VTKQAPGSPNKIDAAIGAIGAHQRALWQHHNPAAAPLFAAAYR
jgi:hypothetical protein